MIQDPSAERSREAGAKKRAVRRVLERAGEQLAERVPMLRRVPRGAWLASSAAVLLASSLLVYQRMSALPSPGHADYFYQPPPAFSLFRTAWWKSPLVIGAGRELPVFTGTLNGLALQPASAGLPARVWVVGNRGLLAYSEDHGRCWTPMEYVSDTGARNFGEFRRPEVNPCVSGETRSLASLEWPRIVGRVYAAVPVDQPALRFSPSRLDFGPLPVGATSDPRKVEVTNISPEAVPIVNVALAGSEARSFRLLDDRCRYAELGPKMSCSIGVIFEPSFEGAHRADLIFVDERTKGEHTLKLLGSGISRAPVQQTPYVIGSSPVKTEPESARLEPPMEALQQWNPPVDPPDILALEFTDARTGVAVAANGTLFRTRDTGGTWQADPQRNGSYLFPRQPNGDWGEFVFRAPDRRSVLATQTARVDYGDADRWRKPYPYFCDRCELRAFRIFEEIGWAVAWRDKGADGSDRNLLFRRDSAGQWWPASRAALPEELQWRLAEEDRARHEVGLGALQAWHLPPPWFFAALLLTLLVAVPALMPPLPVKPKDQAQAGGVEGVLISDKPLEPGEADALGLKTIALGLSRFLRNEKTLPPLTIAINGEWGTGKSSLMNLLRRDLESYGLRPVWFNAWHHQKEEHLLASLLQTVRLEGVPPLWQLHGVPFRAKLLWYRVRRNLPMLVLLLSAILFVGVLEYYVVDQQHPHGFLTWLIELIGDVLVGTGTPEQHRGVIGQLPWLTSLLGVGAALHTLWRGLTAFGANPAALLATISHGHKIKDLNAQSSFRARFATEFREVTQALNPHRPLVIFIDDLDRCNPTNVLQVLEAVNFLVSSGDCFVILGMARQPVEGAVGYAFKDLAGTMVKDPRQFAHEYLDKLINIEVPVPLAKGGQAGKLFAPRPKPVPEPVRERSLRYAVRSLQWAVPAFLAALIGIGAWQAGKAAVTPVRDFMERVDTSRKTAQSTTAEKPASGVKLGTAEQAGPRQAETARGTPGRTSLGGGSVSGGVGGVAPATPAEPRPEIRSGEMAQFSEWLFLSPSYFVGLFLLVVAQLVLTTRPGLMTHDSQRFSQALEIWHGLVLARQGTPRAAKRFVNRVRFLAMRQSIEQLKASRWERALFPERLEVHIETAPIASDGQPKHIPESLLVALAAIEQIEPGWVYGDGDVKDLLAPDGPSQESVAGTRKLFVDARRAHTEKLRDWNEIVAHRERFLEIWPQVTVR